MWRPDERIASQSTAIRRRALQSISWLRHTVIPATTNGQSDPNTMTEE